MTEALSNIRIAVDLTNPGQFFACCGLLELADRLWPGAEGWFDEDKFHLMASKDELNKKLLIHELLTVPEFDASMDKRKATGSSNSKLLPVALTFPKSRLVIDWWCDRTRKPHAKSSETFAKSDFKTWSGNQSPQQIVYDKLLPAIRLIVTESSEQDIFFARANLSGRFGFDHSAALKAIDVGWSTDKHNVGVGTSPVVELLAMIGLQRFRPRKAKKDYYDYQFWTVPLACPVAAASVGGALPSFASSAFRFQIAKRGDYRYFTKSIKQGVQNDQ